MSFTVLTEKKERKTRPWSLHNHQTKCCLQGWLIPLAFWPYQFCVWPWKAQCYNLSTTFFNKRKFRQIKTSLKNHHRSRYWQENKLFLGYPHQSKIKFKSSKCTEMKEKMGVADQLDHATPIKVWKRKWLKEHLPPPQLQQNTRICNNSFFCCLILIFLISFVYKRECLPNRTRGNDNDWICI